MVGACFEVAQVLPAEATVADNEAGAGAGAVDVLEIVLVVVEP